jgi:hypothetical protein
MMSVHLFFWCLGQCLSWGSFGFGVLSIAYGGLTFAHWRRPVDALRGVGFATAFWMMTISLHVMTPSIGQTPVSAWMIEMLGDTA